MSVTLSLDKPRVYFGVRVPIDKLTFVERKPPVKTSNTFTNPEPVIDAREVLERIDIVRRESLQRIDDDVDILKSYLKTQARVLPLTLSPMACGRREKAPCRSAACITRVTHQPHGPPSLSSRDRSSPLDHLRAQQ